MSTQSPSVNVKESPSGTAAIQGTSTSIGGFMGVAQKGPINSPQYISSPDQFQAIFGGPITSSYLYEQVNGFFNNGGAACWVNRVAAYGTTSDVSTLTATKASLALMTAAGGATAGAVTAGNAGPYNLASGDTLVFAVDGGANVTATFNATQASVTGTGGTFTGLTGQTLVVQTNNDGNNQSFTFDGTVTNVTQAAAFINNTATNFHAHVVGGQLQLTADRSGTASKLQIVGGTSLTALGLSATTANGTGSAANAGQVSHAELAALITGASSGVTYAPVTGSAGPGVITSKTTGTSSDVNVVSGNIASKVGFATGHHYGSASAGAVQTGQIQASSEGAWGANLSVSVIPTNTVCSALAASLAAGATTQATLKNTAQVSVGDFVRITDGTNTVRVQVTAINGTTIGFASVTLPNAINAASSQVILERFNVQVSSAGALLAAFNNLAMSPANAANYWVSQINNTAGTPIYALDSFASVADARPAPLNLAQLTGGSDGSVPVDADYLGNAANKLGFYAFDTVSNLNLLSVPGITSVVTQRGLVDYCTNRGDVFYILTLPAGLTPQQAQTYYAMTLNAVSSYGASYYPWNYITSPLTGLPELSPQDGFVQGAFANTDRVRNVSKVAAGTTDGLLKGVIGLERNLTTADYDLLYPYNINAVMNKPGAGICIWGSRTMQRGDFGQIATRRLFLYVEKSISEALEDEVFENSDPSTWASITRRCTAFLRGLRTANMLNGSKDSEAFFVNCNAQNNPPEVQATGHIVCKVGLWNKDTAEFIDLTFTPSTAALDASLAASA